jgi:hypothetical protein
MTQDNYDELREDRSKDEKPSWGKVSKFKGNISKLD